MIGQLLDGKYEVLRLIGEGGMGAVYEAKHTEDGTRCAVKVINDEAVAKDEVLIQRFEREAYAAKKVVSPNIVEILAAGHDDATGHPYMVMEMLDGENALQVLKRIGPMPPELALRVGIQTCEGLAKAHEAGVVHRDIKPANLFLTEIGDDQHVVKLLDFGVAKFKMDQATESDNESLTRTGSMLGSPMYMSPEQARGLKTIDHRADLWSLGVVLHQLLTGRVPHQDIDGLGELIITICSEPPPPVSDSAPWVSKKIADVISGALKLSTNDRYQDARAFGDALRGCIEGDDTITTSMIVEITDEQKQAPPPEPDPAAKQKAAAAAAAGGFVPLDSTVALDDVEAAMQEAEAAMAARAADDEEPPATQALPDTGDAAAGDGAAGDPNLAATVALPGEFDVPDDVSALLAQKERELKAREAKERQEKAGQDAKPPSTGRARDERALAKHREAQRAAIEAARLGPSDGGGEDGGGSGRLILAIVAGVLIGGGLLGAYYYKVKSGQSATPSAPITAPTPAPSPAPAPSPTQAPSAEPAPAPSTTASAATSADAAPPAHKVQVFPAYAKVFVGGKAVAPDANGFVELTGEPGAILQVRVTANGGSKIFPVKLTEKGPVPNVLRAPPPQAPKAPKPAPKKP